MLTHKLRFALVLWCLSSIGGVATLVCYAQAPASQPVGATFRPPDKWDGISEASADGNPLKVAGKPLWRLDHVWPADWKDPANFKPLIWTNSHWGLLKEAPGEHQKRPDVRITKGQVRLAAFVSRWGTEGPGISNKTPGLVFIAPKRGIYKLNAQADVDMTDGKGPIQLLVIKHDVAGKVMKKLMEEEVKNGETIKLADLTAELQESDELIVMPWVLTAREGCTVDLHELTISMVE